MFGARGRPKPAASGRGRDAAREPGGTAAGGAAAGASVGAGAPPATRRPAFSYRTAPLGSRAWLDAGGGPPVGAADAPTQERPGDEGDEAGGGATVMPEGAAVPMGEGGGTGYTVTAAVEAVAPGGPAGASPAGPDAAPPGGDSHGGADAVPATVGGGAVAAAALPEPGAGSVAPAAWPVAEDRGAPQAAGDGDPPPAPPSPEDALAATPAGPETPEDPRRAAPAADAEVAAAAAVLEAVTPRGPRSGGTPDADALTFAEACAVLSISAYVLRRLLDDFEDVLPPLVDAPNERRLPRSALGPLLAIARWRNEGLGQEEIRRRAQGLQSGGSGVADADGGGQDAADDPAVGRLLSQVSRLHEELARQEERRAEDRDRMLTALMRTNQELQHLRFDLAAKTRKERRKGLWGRLFG